MSSPERQKLGQKEKHVAKISTILVADDDISVRLLLKDLFEKEGYRVIEASTGAQALAEIIKPDQPDLVFLDDRMPELSGIEVLRHIRQMNANVGTIFMSDFPSSGVVIKASQFGVDSYFTKPFDLNDVLTAVRRYFEYRSLHQEVYSLKRLRGGRDPSELLIGRHPSMLKLYESIGRVAASDATVIITGETGTGKELVAQEIHRHSNRKNNPLVRVAIAGLAETLVESELFGHEKGAFTGAVTQHIGRFELAHSGTIFLDEISEMTKWTQVRLLRVLQEGEFERVGGSRTIKIDARIIAATNRDLTEEVIKGNFRQDLYYRLKVLRIAVPALREHLSDISILVEHFLDKHRYTTQRPPAKISTDALVLLEHHDWPGNIRQLENVIESAVALSQGLLITPKHLDLNP